MTKDLCHESNADLLSSLLNIPAENIACKRISDILTAPRSIKGIGHQKAHKLYVLKEIIRRIMAEPPSNAPIIRCAEDISNFFTPRLRYETKEQFVLALLGARNKLIVSPTISIGTLTASFVHPREIFTEALKYPCAAIVLIHNHPSGDPTPSKEDINVTRKLVSCGKTMEIPVVDHVIIGDNTYYSMKEHGYIRK